jgi:hypothetical protein
MSNSTIPVTVENLSNVMEFDHVIEVHDDGHVTDAPDGIYAPSLLDGDLDSGEWTLMKGYSGQHGYSGPVMHNSEFIGGRMADDILSQPGFYVAIASYWTNDDPEDGDNSIEGWAVAFMDSNRITPENADKVNAAIKELWAAAEEAGLSVLMNDDEADDGTPQVVLTLEGRWPDGPE